MRLPIMAGALRGWWWIPNSGGKVLRLLTGSYEREQTELFRRMLIAGDTVFDIGAHVGYYTLLSSTLVGPSGKVVAFEPNPPNAGFLRRHVEINRCENVQVQSLAMSDAGGRASFAPGSGTGTGRLHESGGISVRTETVDGFSATHGLTPTAMKIDVEGAELHVLNGARRVLEVARPVIFLSTHGARVHTECLQVLKELDYTLRPMIGDDLDRTAEVLALPRGRGLPQ